MQINTTIITNKFSKGTNSKRYIMIHHDASAPTTPDLNAVKYLAENPALVSCHYVVGRSGTIRQIADDSLITRHAGKGSLDGIVDTMNNHAIGIEVVSDGKVFTEAQKVATKELIKHLMSKHKIPKEKVIRHATYAPGRKRDIAPVFYNNDWTAYQNSLVEQKPKYNMEIINNALNGNSVLWNNETDVEVRKVLENANNVIRKKYGLKV